LYGWHFVICVFFLKRTAKLRLLFGLRNTPSDFFGGFAQGEYDHLMLNRHSICMAEQGAFLLRFQASFNITPATDFYSGAATASPMALLIWNKSH
jgi:hypothetical protein